MGFRTGAWATVWEAEDRGKYSNVRLSISKKSRTTGQFETDFSGYCNFIGAAHEAIKVIPKVDRLRLRIGDCEVTNSYDKKTKQTFTHYAVFSVEMPDDTNTVVRKTVPMGEDEDFSEEGNVDDAPF